MTVLDLCSGDGYFTAPLARLVGGRVYALDIDPAMIDRASAEVARQDASVLQWICTDAHLRLYADLPQHPSGSGQSAAHQSRSGISRELFRHPENRTGSI